MDLSHLKTAPEPKQAVSIRLSEDHILNLSVIGTKEGLKTSDLIREAVSQFIAKYNNQ